MTGPTPESDPTPDPTPQTGEPRVDDALARVADLDDVDLDEHAERLAAAHASLQEVLRSPLDPDA